jgi:Short C-terminal domain
MKFRRSPEERAAAEAQKRREQERRERPMWDHLEAAVQAAAAGDIPLEEREIQRGARCAEAINGVLGREIKAYNERLEDYTRRRKLRRGKLLGNVGQIWIWEDRILAADKSVYRMDEHVQADVDTAGNITESRRPTLTRMAMGAALPGSALIPGFALAKKETADYRELYFILEHSEWGAVIKVNPEFGEVVRTIAVGVNQAARRLAIVEADTAAPPSPAPGPPDALDRLHKLGQLRDSGVLTEEEFAVQKAKLLAEL